MNTIQLLLGLADDVMNDLVGGAEALVERANRTVAQLKLAIAVPFGLFFLAMLIGGFGQSASADAAAQGFMDAAALISCVLFAGVVFNAAVIGQYVSLGSLAINTLTAGKVPKLEPVKAVEFARGLLAAATWIMVMSNVAMHVPLWRSVHWTIVIATGACAMAGIMMSWGLKTPGMKYFASALVAAIMVLGFLQFVPSFKRYGLAVSADTMAHLDRLSEEKEAEAKRIAAHLPEPVATTEVTNANAAPPVASPAARHLVLVENASNANAAPPTLTGGQTDEANEPPTDEAAQAKAEKPQPRVAGEMADAFDQAYGDLLK